MTMLNILPRYLPVFRRIVGQMQHDLFHVYTVDQHTLAVVRNIRRFTMPEHAQEYPLASQLIANLRSEEHTSELQSLMRISYAVFCLKKNKNHIQHHHNYTTH